LLFRIQFCGSLSECKPSPSFAIACRLKLFAKAALKLMRKLQKKQGWAPTRFMTDKLWIYHVAFRTLGLTAEHIDD